MRAWRAVLGAALVGVFAFVLMFSGYLTYLAVSAFNVPVPEIVGLSGGTGSAAVAWALKPDDQARASEVDHFVIYRATQPGGPFQKVSEVRGATQWGDANLENGQPYYYVVTARDKRGNESKAGEARPVTPMISPRGCRAVAGNRRISVSWYPAVVKNLKHYAVYRNGRLIQQTRSTSVVDSDVKRGGRYVYTVRAVCASGAESADSNRAAATAFETCTRCGGDGKVTCPRCGGDGRDSATCYRCGGDGDCNTCGGDGRITSTCDQCKGRGWITCPTCKGRGRLS